MASAFPKRGFWWIKVQGWKVPGKWSTHPTDPKLPATEENRAEAIRQAGVAQAAIDKRRGIRSKDATTLREWVSIWIPKRREAGKDWKKELGRLENHVLPVLGGHDLPDITTAMLVDLVHDLRFKKGVANRTARNIYGTLALALKAAAKAGKIAVSPAQLDDEDLGPIIDKDPEWREGAVYTRKEAETLIGSPKIPLDRRVVYGFGMLAGLRPGEAAALRWKNYDVTREPLGCLTVAFSYSTTYSATKRTKTNSVRKVPVHPTLAGLLAELRAGWRDIFGHEPGDDDLIVPLPPDVKRTKRTGDRFRGTDYTGRRWRDIDLPALGWRPRSVYDAKSTFITLAIEDGAKRDILRERVTHTKPKRDAFDGYDRGEHWLETCREVAKLKLRSGFHVVPESAFSDEDEGLRRRVSNDSSGPPELRLVVNNHEVIVTDHDLSRAFMEPRCFQAEREDSEDKDTGT